MLGFLELFNDEQEEEKIKVPLYENTFLHVDCSNNKRKSGKSNKHRLID